MNRWILILACVLVVAGTAQAETWEGRWSLGLEGGVAKQIGGDADYSNVGPLTGLKIRHGFTKAFTLDLGIKYGWTRPGVAAAVLNDEARLTFSAEEDLYTRIWQPNLSGTYRFVDDGTWRPWMSLGAAVTRWDLRDLTGESAGIWPDGTGTRVLDENGTQVDGHGVNFTGIVGLGTEIVAGDNVSFDVGVRYNYLLDQDRDSVGLSSLAAPGGSDVNSGIFEGMFGVNFVWGTTDSDGDGIPNDIDADPNAPEDFDGFEDTDGAPEPDNDRDGVLDVDDGAPNDPEDRDGFEDADGVPDLDNDRDGVADVKDGAPNDPEDMDGFEDADGVPDPDNDGDGILDGMDECADTPRDVEVDEKGCPVVEEIREALVLEGVNFESNSAELVSGFENVLRRVAESLRAWPEVRIEVGGHTDSRGAADHNLQLSEARAESVRDFLVAQGIDESRITAVGYGELSPIADNGTETGRAANRRVEVRRIGG